MNGKMSKLHRQIVTMVQKNITEEQYKVLQNMDIHLNIDKSIKLLLENSNQKTKQIIKQKMEMIKKKNEYGVFHEIIFDDKWNFSF